VKEEVYRWNRSKHDKVEQQISDIFADSPLHFLRNKGLVCFFQLAEVRVQNAGACVAF
jgi:hypothetical protein